MKSLADSTAKVAAPILGKRNTAEAEIMLHWTEIIGEDLAKSTRPLKLVFAKGGERRDGTLQLRVVPAAALEIQHMEPLLIERINGVFGYRAVARLSLRQGPVQRPGTKPRRNPAARPLGAAEEQRLKHSLDGIEDPELREMLEKLGRTVLGARGTTT